MTEVSPVKSFSIVLPRLYFNLLISLYRVFKQTRIPTLGVTLYTISRVNPPSRPVHRVGIGGTNVWNERLGRVHPKPTSLIREDRKPQRQLYLVIGEWVETI